MRLEPDSILLTLLTIHYEHRTREPNDPTIELPTAVEELEWIADLYSEDLVDIARRCEECSPYAEKHTAALDREIEALSNGIEYLFDDELRDQLTKGILKLRAKPFTLFEQREIMRETLKALGLLSESEISAMVERRLPA
jgi:hypothetical protein